MEELKLIYLQSTPLRYIGLHDYGSQQSRHDPSSIHTVTVGYWGGICDKLKEGMPWWLPE